MQLKYALDTESNGVIIVYVCYSISYTGNYYHEGNSFLKNRRWIPGLSHYIHLCGL